jgi:flagellar motility protein MotE (MotC chaperone)
MRQPRLIPVTLAALTLLLGVRAAHLWRDADSWVVGAAEAQTAPPAPAAAKGAGQAATAPAKGAAGQAAAAPAAAADSDPGALPDLSRMTKGEMEILQGLAERRQKLDARAREIELRENLLAAAEKRIDERIAELKRIEASVSAVVKRQEEAQERDIKSLVKVYENMKPKDAARIFEDLELPILLEVVERMREAKLAPVLALLDPARAQKITVQLAERRNMPAAGRAAAKAPVAPAAVRPVAADNRGG